MERRSNKQERHCVKNEYTIVCPYQIGKKLIIRVPFYNPPSEYGMNKFANKVSPICSRNYWGSSEYSIATTDQIFCINQILQKKFRALTALLQLQVCDA